MYSCTLPILPIPCVKVYRCTLPILPIPCVKVYRCTPYPTFPCCAGVPLYPLPVSYLSHVCRCTAIPIMLLIPCCAGVPAAGEGEQCGLLAGHHGHCGGRVAQAAQAGQPHRQPVRGSCGAEGGNQQGRPNRCSAYIQRSAAISPPPPPPATQSCYMIYISV